jgi:glycogen synthase
LFDQETIRDRLSHNVQALSHQIEAFQPDVCLAGNLDFLGAGTELIEALLDQKIPIAHYVMNASPGYPVELAPQQSSYRYITCSNWIIHSLAAKGYPLAHAQAIYPGADVEAFYQPELPKRDRLRIAYASIVGHYKGTDVLLEALAVLNASGIEFSATIAGGTFHSEFVEALKAFVISEGMDDRIRFPGALSRNQLRELYTTHNVLVFPSRFQEPFGISQIEAMAAGLTLITSGTGGAGEIVCAGEDGLLFESENPLALADALSFLAASPEAWEQLAYKGQRKAMTEFNQTKALAKLENALFDLISIHNVPL